ncbi:MAG: ATP-binding protein [Acidimicrobiia bacterium]
MGVGRSNGPVTPAFGPTRLRQIVRNLVTNALRYGGDRVQVLVSGTGVVSQILVQVSGGPIPASRVATMFNPFGHWDDGVARPTLSALAWRLLEASLG